MICEKYPNISFLGCQILDETKALASFSEYIMFLEMCTNLIFHGKRQSNYPFWLIKEVTFLQFTIGNSNGKGQYSNGKGQMSHSFCYLPLPLSVMVTVRTVTVKDKT